VVIRGEVVRKLGHPILEINIASGRKFKPNAGQQNMPVFSGTLSPEIAYYGFDLSLSTLESNRNKAFFVIYEPLGQLRFGLDIANAEIRNQRRDLSQQFYGFKLGSIDRLVSPRAPAMNLVQAATPPPSASNIDSWDDFSWSHVAPDEAGYVNFNKNVSTATGKDFWSADKHAAGIARSFMQKPLAAYMPISRVL